MMPAPRALLLLAIAGVARSAFCPSGTYSATGQTPCTACADGLNSPSGSTACAASYPMYAYIADLNPSLRVMNLQTTAVTTLPVPTFQQTFAIEVSKDRDFMLFADAVYAIICRIDLPSLTQTIIAGKTAARGQADGVGSDARFTLPYGLALSPDNSYALVTDMATHAVRKVTLADGATTTLTGASLPGYREGSGTAIQFNQPKGIAISPAGDFAVVADNAGCRVRRLNLNNGGVATSSLIAGSGVCGTNSNVDLQYPVSVVISPDAKFVLMLDLSYGVRKIDLTTLVVTALPYLFTGDQDPVQIAWYTPKQSILVALLASSQIARAGYPTGNPVIMAGKTVIGGGFANSPNGLLAQFKSVSAVAITRCSLVGYGYNEAAGTCAQCPTNTIGKGDGACVACAACSPGSYQAASCTLVADTVCAACTVCGPGQRMLSPCNATTDAVCVPCPAGSVCVNGAVAQGACTPGSFCPAGSSAAIPCPAGTVCPTPAQSFACGLGSYCGAGSTLEVDCPLGRACATAAVQAECVPPSYCPPRSTKALLCPAGFACPDPSTIAACPASSYFCAQGSTAPSPCGACALGQYLVSTCSPIANAVCAPCVGLPLHASFTAVGSAADACPWVCDPGFVFNATRCDPCPPGSWCSAGARNACPLHTASPPRSSSQNDCLCLPGYAANGSAPGTSPCRLCEAGTVCPGGASPPVACPTNRTSPPGATSLAADCQCSPGYRADGGRCTMCGPDEVCYDNGTVVLGCPPHSHAPPASDSLLDCLCDPGFYAPGVCAPCPPDAYCGGGAAPSPTRCTAHALAPERSVSADACYCDRGYYDAYGDGGAPLSTTNQSNFTATAAAFMRRCAPCPQGAWCWTGVLNACPDNATSPPLSSRPLNCTCRPGYTGAAACAPCPPGAYKPDNGTAPCQAPCPADAFCPLATATPFPCPSDAPNARQGAFDPAQCQSDADFYLAMCPAPAVCPTPPPPPPSSGGQARCTHTRGRALWALVTALLFQWMM